MKLSFGTVLACLAGLSIAAPSDWPVQVKKPAPDGAIDRGMFKDTSANN
jgi:hypothetical protein